MNNTLSKVLIFAAGAAVGSIVTWKLVKTKYEQIANEEIKSVKEVFGMMADSAEDEADDDVSVKNPEPEFVQRNTREKDLQTTHDILEKNGYVNYSDSEDKNRKMEDVEKPYVIPPEEYGELYDYDTIELTYYADGILADDINEIVEDVDEIVGYYSLTTFGEYEDDSVHVRNDKLKVDYEILRSLDKYSDVAGIGPRRAEE